MLTHIASRGSTTNEPDKPPKHAISNNFGYIPADIITNDGVTEEMYALL
jgi:hypothetical protein